MPFQKGHKLAKGGRREGAGRKSAAEKQAQDAFLKALIKERDKRALRLANRYFDFAEQDPATMRHAVDKVIANAKQEIEHSGKITYEELKTNVDFDK